MSKYQKQSPRQSTKHKLGYWWSARGRRKMKRLRERAAVISRTVTLPASQWLSLSVIIYERYILNAKARIAELRKQL
jgi:hypothetical protein